MDSLKDTLAKSRPFLYFRHFEASPNALTGIPTADLIDDYARLKAQMDLAWRYRQKLFHGQLTGSNLTTQDLTDIAAEVTTWCRNLSKGAFNRFGYDGFDGTSYAKRGSHRNYADIVSRVDQKIADLAAYKAFLKSLG